MKSDDTNLDQLRREIATKKREHAAKAREHKLLRDKFCLLYTSDAADE